MIDPEDTVPDRELTPEEKGLIDKLTPNERGIIERFRQACNTSPMDDAKRQFYVAAESQPSYVPVCSMRDSKETLENRLDYLTQICHDLGKQVQDLTVDVRRALPSAAESEHAPGFCSSCAIRISATVPVKDWPDGFEGLHGHVVCEIDHKTLCLSQMGAGRSGPSACQINLDPKVSYIVRAGHVFKLEEDT